MSKEHDKFCWVALSLTPEEEDCGCSNLAEIRQDEQERIIKLLLDHGYVRPNRWSHDAEFIAIIKGENK